MPTEALGPYCVPINRYVRTQDHPKSSLSDRDLVAWCASFFVAVIVGPYAFSNGRLMMLGLDYDFFPGDPVQVKTVNPLGLLGDMVWALRPPEQLFINSGHDWPLWPIPAMFVVIAIVLRTSSKLGHCRCGYDLTGNTSGVCPECGSEISTADEDSIDTANMNC